MAAGLLRRRVRLERATETLSDQRETVQTWAEIATVWGRVVPLKGREFFAAQQTQNPFEYRVEIRYSANLADLSPKDRALDGSLTFDIRSVLIDERRRFIHLMCTAHG